MRSLHSLRLGLALASLAALGAATAAPANAQSLLYTLSGITFDDGAVATGSFNFDPTTRIFGTFDLTTTNGVTDTLRGVSYFPGASKTPPGAILPDAATPDTIFTFTSTKAQTLVLETVLTSATTPGVFALRPGRFAPAGTVAPGSPDQILNSGELIPVGNGFGGRGILTGSLLVTGSAGSPVPEASTTISLGLLLTLGGAALVVKKRKASSVGE